MLTDALFAFSTEPLDRIDAARGPVLVMMHGGGRTVAAYCAREDTICNQNQLPQCYHVDLSALAGVPLLQSGRFISALRLSIPA